MTLMTAAEAAVQVMKKEGIGMTFGVPGAGGHRHDHGTVFGPGGFFSDSVHHRPGPACQAAQGRLPGRRYQGHRGPRHQMGDNGS